MKKTGKPDKVKRELKKVSDHLKIQNETLKKMLAKLSVNEDTKKLPEDKNRKDN